MPINFVRPMYKSIRQIYAEAVASTTANTPSVINIVNSPCMVQCTTGSLYFSTLTTAPTSTNAILLRESDEPIFIQVPSYIAFVSATTTAQRQVIVFDS